MNLIIKETSRGAFSMVTSPYKETQEEGDLSYQNHL